MNLEIQGTIVLERILDDWKYKGLVEQGGSRSSKTTSIIQALLIKAQQEKGKVYTIVRDKLTWIKSTVLVDFAQLVEKYKLKVTPAINPNRAEQIYYINGNEFAFFGLDYPQKLHGRSQDVFWMNESMECSKSAFDQLEMRTREKFILDYNPSDDTHWVFDLHKRDDVVFHHSTMLDNPFLPQTIVDKIKSYEPTKRNIEMGTADSYMWEVYGLGNPARLQGVIFENWEECNVIPEGARQLGLGLDFGFSSDPCAVIDCYYYDKAIYLDELVYETKLTNQLLSSRMEGVGIVKGLDEIIADSAEPKSIEELSVMGWNIKGAVKGADSVNFGIDLMRSHKIYITKSSVNLQMEFRRYKWAEDKIGNSLNKPIDGYNHGIDASRYLLTEKLKEGSNIKILNLRDVL